MAQSAVTVRLDSEMKAQFDKLCAEFGMSVNTAFNIFVNTVVRRRKIPFEITATKDSLSFNKGLEAFYALREEARKNGLQDMTLDEINKEIRLAREEREAME